MTATLQDDWWLDTSNLAALYEYLRDCDEAPDVVDFLRKPWHFSPEWTRMHTVGDSTDDRPDTDPSELAP